MIAAYRLLVKDGTTGVEANTTIHIADMERMIKGVNSKDSSLETSGLDYRKRHGAQ